MPRQKLRIEETQQGIYRYTDVFVGDTTQRLASVEYRPGREPLITVLNNGLSIAEAMRVCAGLKAAIKVAKKITEN